MPGETVEERLARLEGKIEAQKEKTEQHAHALFGEDNQSGLVREFRDIRTETRYLRYIYLLVGALILPIVNALLSAAGFGPLKLPGS